MNGDLSQSDLEQGLYIPTIESRVIRREARADNAQPVLLCVVEAGLDILVRATKWGNYGGALKMTGRGWQDIVTSTRLYVGRQLQVEVIGSFTAPKSASHENPGSAPRAVVLSFRTLQIVHVTDDLHAPATANDASTAPVSQAAQAAKPDAAAVGPGAVTQPAPSRRKRTCAETPPLTSQAATPQAPAAGGTCGSEACAVHLQRMESRISQLEVTPSDVSCPMGTSAAGPATHPDACA